jgi:hypothetical protein
MPDAQLPTFLVIGGMKCGTTSLHFYLSLHPEIFMSKTKELRFFVEHNAWPKGIEWYRSQFVTERRERGETSPQYSNSPLFPGVPLRIHSVIPEAKLIYVLRDPVERLVSQYMHEVSEDRERKDFAAAVWNGEPSRYVLRSRYCYQLEQYLPYFPLSRILIVTSEDLRARRAETLRQVFRFLGVEETFSHARFSEEWHHTALRRKLTETGRLVEAQLRRAGIGKLPPKLAWKFKYAFLLPFSRAVERPALDEELRERLADALRNDMERLRRLTGRMFESWSV